MLVNKYEADQIVSFKLVNGDEIVAKLIEENNDTYTIEKPCTVMPSQQGLGLIQSLFTSELNKNVTLEKKHVMLHQATMQKIVDHYIKTTTGIETAGASSEILQA
jgi:hypothetical protein|tara:strand:- start:50 stop:364 length:315 start_codon:yes stop_codon:yes gene_type:complete